ncbi:hypothetical protein HN011_009749 [Eciton burchellii]|nr:hypothetical protein HN011_009749 [Eciton burchellii]
MTQFGEDARRHSETTRKEPGHVRGRISESVALPFTYEIRAIGTSRSNSSAISRRFISDSRSDICARCLEISARNDPDAEKCGGGGGGGWGKFREIRHLSPQLSQRANEFAATTIETGCSCDRSNNRHAGKERK